MSPKNWVWVICLVLILPILLIHLYIDDDLEPRAKVQLELLSRQPNLSNNAFIKMMSLGQKQTDNKDDVAISKQSDTLTDRRNAHFSEVSYAGKQSVPRLRYTVT